MTSIGRITTGGTVTNFTGTGISEPVWIAAGPDGALWFTNEGNDSIGRITTGGTVTNFTGTGISEPQVIAAGPDGALWFTNEGNDSIGRITTGGTVTNFTGTGISEPVGIAAGPDGAVWFTNHGNSSIGRIQAVVPPTVSGVSPGSGPSSGGTSITITGTRFVSGDTVEIAQGQGAGPSAIPATNVTVVSPTEITATTGGGAKPGPFHVFVTDNGATSAAGSAVFTYTVPVVSGVSPTSGSVNGGTVITITGQQFVSGASVQIAQGQGAGPSAIAATDVTVVSPTEITATTGGGAKPGPFHVFVTENGVTSASGSAVFTYTVPVVSGVSPTSGSVNGGTAITITGTGFASGASVQIAQGQGAGPTAIAATNVTVVSPTEITATTGGGAKRGTFHLFVTSDAKTSAPNDSDRYTYTLGAS